MNSDITGQEHLQFLPNGNRLVLLPDPHATSVGLAIITDGCREEPKLLVGHFTEHLIVDKGHYPTYPQYARRLDFLVRDFNAEISREWMVVYARTLPEDFVKCFQMASSTVLRPKFSKRLFREIQGLVLEKKDGEDKVIDQLHDLGDETIYRGHALANRMVGTQEELLAVTLEDIRSWHAHLLSQPITVAIVGNFDPGLAKRLVTKAFGRLPQTSAKPGPRFIIRQRQLRVRPVRWPIQLVNLLISSVSPFGFGHPDRIILGAINNHLGEHLRWSSRVGLRLVGDDKLRMAYTALTSVWHHRDCGELSFRTAIEPTDVEEVIRILVEEFRRLKEHRVNEQELATIKKWLIDGSGQRSQDVTQAATFYGQQVHVTGRLITHPEYVELVERTVTPAAIQRVARRVFRRNRTSVVLVGPTHRVRLDQIPRIFSNL